MISYDTIPSELTPDFLASATAVGFSFSHAPDGWITNNDQVFLAYHSVYPGSADQIAASKTNSHGTGKLDQLNAVYLGKFGGGFNYTGPDGVKRTFQIDPTSQFNIDVQANASLGAILNGEVWDANSYFIAADNSHMPTPTAQDMRAFSLAVRGYVAQIILRNRALKDQISAAADMAALSAVDINSGWPSNP